jgi:hypothetical protein
MSYVLATEPYSDTSRLLSELPQLIERVRVSMGWNTDNLQALLPAWKAGTAVIITDRQNELLEGGAVILRTASAIHDADALVLLMAPAPERFPPLLQYCKMVARMHGAKGLSLMVDMAAPLDMLDDLAAQGFRAKATTYGVKL